MPTTNLAAVAPQELQQLDQWVVWRTEERGGKPTKVPYQPDGRHAKANDPATWTSFAAAVDAAEAGRFDGVGFMFTADDPYAGIDFDDVLDPDTGEWQPWAADIIGQLDSYTEISPSGTGAKVWVKASIPGPRSRTKKIPKSWGPVGDVEVEMYDRERYFTVTGHQYGTRTTVEPRQAVVDKLYADLFPAKREKAPSAPQDSAGRAASLPADLTDAELVQTAQRARNGAAFTALWNGDLSGHAGDQSAADLALANHLAFYCGPDPSRIERIFGQSALGQRDKWQERSDYRESTIACALDGRTEFYRPRGAAPVANGHQVAAATDADVRLNVGSSDGDEAAQLPLATRVILRWLGKWAVPLYREAGPERLTVWHRRDARPVEIPARTGYARTAVEQATGQPITELLDREVPLPPKETKDGEEIPQSWSNKRGTAYECMADALTLFGRTAPWRDTLVELGRGVHVVTSDDQARTIIVSGPTPLWCDRDGWYQSPTPVCYGGIVHHNAPDIGKPWAGFLTPASLAAKPARSLHETLRALSQSLRVGWRLAEPWAYDVLTLWTAYAVVAHAWERRVYVHLLGDSSTGKSSLLGFLTRNPLQPGAGLLPHAAYESDITEAALVGTYGRCALPLVLDEWERSEAEQRIREILAAARRAFTGSATKRRGRSDGSVRSSEFTWPLMVASIEPLDSNEADANRFMQVSTRKELGHDAERALAAHWRQTGDSPEKIRADLWPNMLALVPQIGTVTASLRHSLTRPDGVPARSFEGLLPLLAVAELAGEGRAAQELDIMAPALRERSEATARLSPQAAIVDALLHTTWQAEVPGGLYGDRLERQTRTVAVVIAEAAEDAKRHPEEPSFKPYAVHGVVVERTPEGDELWLNLATVLPGILSRSPWRGQKSEGVQQLLARHEAYRGSKATTRAGIAARWQRFDLATLQPQCDEPEDDPWQQ